ncbi:MAG: hypothetical protein AAGK57_04885, partial [Pseudomonadota bacterium]
MFSRVPAPTAQLRLRSATSLALLVALTPGLLHAQDVWTGAQSQAWTDGRNWQDGTVPTDNQRAVIDERSTRPNATIPIGTTRVGGVTVSSDGQAN